MSKLSYLRSAYIEKLDEWIGEDIVTFLCSWCNRTLGKLIDSSGQNPSYYCNFCRIELNPENENLRKVKVRSTR
ncbi:MAG: hypothetical protein M3297_06440 [Thermoproteota archaeon]|nr:hypothetical protein [Thermoproteota archaeon]